jgi:hypothetical protein
MKVLAIAVVLGLVLTGLTVFIDVGKNPITLSPHTILNFQFSFGNMGWIGHHFFGLPFPYLVSTQYTTGLLIFNTPELPSNPMPVSFYFGPFAFIIDFLIFFAICFSILFVSDFLSEKKKEKYRIMKQELRYGRRKIKRR